VDVDVDVVSNKVEGWRSIIWSETLEIGQGSTFGRAARNSSSMPKSFRES
jgi:hypothetical protein